MLQYTVVDKRGHSTKRYGDLNGRRARRVRRGQRRKKLHTNDLGRHVAVHKIDRFTLTDFSDKDPFKTAH